MGVAGDVAVARGALVELLRSAAGRRTITARVQSQFAEVRRYVPETVWAPLANSLGELRVYETREELLLDRLAQRVIEEPK